MTNPFDGRELTVHEIQLLNDYVRCRAEIAALTERADKARDQLAASLGEYPGLISGRVAVTVTRTFVERFDIAAYRAANPHQYRTFMRPATHPTVKLNPRRAVIGNV